MTGQIIQFQPRFIRFCHWSHVVLIITTVATGIYTYHPQANLLTMGHVRLVHQASAYLDVAVVITWIYGSFATGLQNVHSLNLAKLNTLTDLLRYYLFLTETPPPGVPKYNIGAILVHLSWLTVFSMASLMGIVLAFPEFFQPVARLLGGYQLIRFGKYLIALYFLSTIPLHIYLATTEDPARLQAMVTGRLRPALPQPPKPRE